MSFYFIGSGPASKSLMLRALIVKSYFPNFQILENNKFQDCEDVYYMKQGLKILSDYEEAKNKNKITSRKKPNNVYIDCADGGAVLRFLALRCARMKGFFILKGSSSLFNRPLQELTPVLNQLGCKTNIQKNCLEIQSTGGQMMGDALHVSGIRSSQFASAVLLNSWKLSYPLFLKIESQKVSRSYLQMTISFLQNLGMKIHGIDEEYHISSNQKINKTLFLPEQDMSCLFALSAIAVVNGELCITGWPRYSLQPDFIFFEILKKMRVNIKQEGNILKVKKTERLKPIEWNIKNCPDLFPILAVLCSFAKGVSKLYGAPHLVYKESNRIMQTTRLLSLIRKKTDILKDGLIIKGDGIRKSHLTFTKELVFDSKKDHRMVMAGSVLKKAGWPIKILHSESIKKSFPDFLHLTGVKL